MLQFQEQTELSQILKLKTQTLQQHLMHPNPLLLEALGGYLNAAQMVVVCVDSEEDAAARDAERLLGDVMQAKSRAGRIGQTNGGTKTQYGLMQIERRMVY